MAKVEAPNKNYNGPGPGGTVFEDGVANTDDDAALNYFRSAGYKVSGTVDNPVEESPEPADPREVGDEVMGTRLRDAAVDPEPEDFLAPINAGEDNPHGSKVVSPEIHASGPQGLRPGEVFVEDIEKQEQREKEYAEARLIQRTPAPEVVANEVPDIEDKGPLGLSDPGSVAQGVEGAKQVKAEGKEAAKADSDTEDEKPATKKAAAKKSAAKKS